MFHVKLFLFIILLVPIIAYTQHFGTTTLTTKNLPSLPSRNYFIDQFLNKNNLYKSLPPLLKDWFYWTNYSRNNPKEFWDSVVSPILSLYPDFRNSYTISLEKDLMNSPPLPLLNPNKKLLYTSQLLAEDLAFKNSPPSHTSPSGATFGERMRAAGIINCAGENISFGPPNTVLMLVLLYIDQGVPQLGHRHSLLNATFTEMGIGTATYTDKNTIIIQDFGCSQ
jgi:hypothetical protein